jgi:hypothetical protein
MTIIIHLTRGYEALVDDCDADLAELKWFAINGYAARRPGNGDRGTLIKLHNVILERKLGRALVGKEMADHKDTNRANYTRENIRLATKSQNCQNVGITSRNSSGYKGVSIETSSGKWKAQIRINGILKNLGRFDDPAMAYEAYCKAGRELHGEFFNPGNGHG